MSAAPPPPPSLAWIGSPGAPGEAPRGRWGPPERLCLPLDDRGLLLGDGLFETLLVARGQPWLLREHLERWREGADLLGLPPPPDARQLSPLIAEAIERGGWSWGALRLTWSRGSGGRGIDPPPAGAAAARARFWLHLSAWRPSFAPTRVIVSATERRHPTNLSSRCKTLAYGWAVQARREARAAGVDDALVLNTAGQLCCATTANLVLRRRGCWFTPPLSSGCLPGVMRGRALALGLIQEAPLEPEALEEAEAGLLLNSLDGRPLALPRAPASAAAEAAATARRLWHHCAGLAVG